MTKGLRQRPARSEAQIETRGVRVEALFPASDEKHRITGVLRGRAALKASGVQYEMHMYPGTQHGFHNNSTPRYHEASAKLAWERTIAFFKKHLA